MKHPQIFEDLLIFLRHDFDANDKQSISERERIESRWGIIQSPESSNETKTLQKELIDDLTTVVIPKRYRRGKERFTRPDSTFNTAPIEDLVAKINAMHLTPEWIIQWVNPRRMVPEHYTDEKFFKLREKAKREAYAYYLESVGRPTTAKAIADEMKKTPIPTSGRVSDMPPVMKFYSDALKKYGVEKNAWVKHTAEPIYPDQGQGLVRVGQQHFYVTKLPYMSGTPRQRLYGEIIEALERGIFHRLRRCAECQKFFSADDLRQKFCASACMKEADKRAARSRVREWRKSSGDRKSSASDVAHVAPSDPLDTFKTFFDLVTKRKLTEGETEKVLPGIKHLGGGSPVKGWHVVGKWQGKKPAEVWDTLPESAKRFFS